MTCKQEFITSSLNIKIEKMEEYSKCFSPKAVSESVVGKVKTSKNIIKDVSKDVGKEVFKIGGVDINVTTFSKVIRHVNCTKENLGNYQFITSISIM